MSVREKEKDYSDTEPKKQPNLNWYKYCFVPSCKNTTSSTPDKDFIHVPQNPLKRKAWFKAIGCPEKKIIKSSFCCEDHFDLKEDLKNYRNYKFFGGRKLLKEGVVPRFNLFVKSDSSNVCGLDDQNSENLLCSLECTNDNQLHKENQTSFNSDTPLSEKSVDFYSCIDFSLSSDHYLTTEDQSIENSGISNSMAEENLNNYSGDISEKNELIEKENSHLSLEPIYNDEYFLQCEIAENNSDIADAYGAYQVGSHNDKEEINDTTIYKYMPFDNKSESLESDKTTKTREIEQDNKKNKSVQISIKPKTYNKICQTDIASKNKSIQVALPKCSNDVGITCDLIPSLTNQIKKLNINKIDSEQNLNATHESIGSSVFDSSISYQPPSSSIVSSNYSEELKLKSEIIKSSVYENYTKIIIEDNPLLFLGIPKDSMYVIDLLHKESGVSIKNIYLILKKIKMNLPNSVLGYEFSICESQVGKIFRTYIHKIAKFMKQLIIWPSKKDILINLPLQFRYRYRDVQSIIDCFEIEIQKPSDAVNQSLTWSSYKNCNSAKYFISITPDGIINYISEGACGRTSDMSIVENCGYLDILPLGTSVLADRGFKQLDTLLQKRNCKLLRPPSVLTNVKSTKKEVKLTKQIASIRIHVERVINRIRNFQFLNIHSRVDNKLLDCLDSAVVIAAALVNLQSEIIKQT